MTTTFTPFPHPAAPKNSQRVRSSHEKHLRVVALTHRVPFPPDKGDKIRTFHLLSRLAARAEVHLACLADPPEDLRHIDHLRGIFASVTAIPMHMAVQKLRALPYLLTRSPLTLPVFDRRPLRSEVARLVREVRPDAFYAESSSMAPYALRHPEVPLVMDFVDVDSAKWKTLAEHAAPAARLAYAREGWALARYEREVASRAVVSLLTAPRELSLFRTVSDDANARVLANGVDTDYFTPREATPEVPSIVFFGAMDYIANVEAAQYLVNAVLPRVREYIPAATVALVGSKPTREVLDLAKVPGVAVSGFVHDIRPHVQRAAISVCPLRVARGVQNKVLEAMAMGVPVIASPAAAEGIDAEAGRDLVVARDDHDGRQFATAIVALLNDRARCESLAKAARARVLDVYGWQPRADELMDFLANAAATGRPGR